MLHSDRAFPMVMLTRATLLAALLASAALLGAVLSGCGDDDEIRTGPTGAAETVARPGSATGRPAPTASAGTPGEAGPTAADQTAPLEGRGTLRLNVTFAPWGTGTAKIAEIQVFDRGTAFLYASDGAEIVRWDLDLSDGLAEGRATVRSAENLRAVVVFYDGQVVRYVGEDPDVDVEIGRETAAEVLCHYMGTWVRAPEIAGVGRLYTVSWLPRPHATGYELQESEHSDFSESVTVYEGTASSYELTGKPEVGEIYHYRARAGTGYGIGPWHSTGAGAVEIHKAEGDVDVKIPIPPEEPERPPVPVYFSDNFNDNALDLEKWAAWISPDATGWVRETDGQLQMWLGPENTASTFHVDAMSTWLLRGDFDIQVDYRLLSWPAHNGIRVGLKAGGVQSGAALDAVLRMNDAVLRLRDSDPEESYVTHFGDGVRGNLPTSDSAGTLRLVRRGDRIAGYYLSHNAWMQIREGPAGREDGPVLLGVWGHKHTGGAHVAFDNFTVNYATIVEPNQLPEPPEHAVETQ